MTFVPEVPEKYVTVKITEREAVLLARLRKYAFGHFTVHKAKGLILRIEINESMIIEPLDHGELT
jgi:DNA-binding transcriptional MocR family regulator